MQQMVLKISWILPERVKPVALHQVLQSQTWLNLSIVVKLSRNLYYFKFIFPRGIPYYVNAVRGCRLIEISENKVFGETLVLTMPKCHVTH